MPKIVVDLNRPLLDLQGGPDISGGLVPSDTKLAAALAHMLRSSQEGDAIKYLNWVIDLAATGKLEVDESDHDTITAFVKGNRQALNLVKGQLLKALNDSKASVTPVT